MAVNEEYLKKIVAYVNTYGEEQTAIDLNLKQSVLERYLRRARQIGVVANVEAKVLSKIQERYTKEELVAISNGGRIMPGIANVPIVSFEGQHIRIGAITDTHIGHQCFEDERLYQAFEEFKKEKVDFITHSGDVTEGMSHRPGHIYELTHLGYDAQKKHAIKLFSEWTDSNIYAISGNHDRWFLKSNGANIVGDLAEAIHNFHFIGHDEGDVSLKGVASLKLWHGEDGSSYALSYRLQKIVESFSGGEKPNALFAGHVHKYVQISERNIYATSVGCLERQTSWMRGKRLSAHVGFCIVDIWVNKTGICKMSTTWYPFYT